MSAADQINGSPGDLFDPQELRAAPTLPCGSLRRHDPHRWVGQSWGETFMCSGHAGPVTVADRVCASREELEAAADQRLDEATRIGPNDSWWED